MKTAAKEAALVGTVVNAALEKCKLYIIRGYTLLLDVFIALD